MSSFSNFEQPGSFTKRIIKLAGVSPFSGLRLAVVVLILMPVIVVSSEIVFRYFVHPASQDQYVSFHHVLDSEKSIAALKQRFPEFVVPDSFELSQLMVVAAEHRDKIMPFLNEHQALGNFSFDLTSQNIKNWRAPLEIVQKEQLSERLKNLREKLQSDPIISKVTFARGNAKSLFGYFEPTLVEGAERLVLPLTESTAFLATRSSGYEGAVTWAGKELRSNGPETFVSMDESRGIIYGIVRRDGMVYEYRPVGGGEYAIVEIDPKKDPGSATSGSDVRAPKPRAAPAKNAERPGSAVPYKSNYLNGVRSFADFVLPRASAQDNANTQIGLVVAYTKDAVQEEDYIHLMAELATNFINVSLKSSGLADIQVNLECVVPLDAVTSRNLRTDLDNFKGVGDGFAESIHDLRSKNNGDLAILITGQSGFGGSYCGLAERIYAESAGSGFAVVRKDCALTLDSFQHEVGHLFGAAHDDHSTESTLHKPYGRGAVYKHATTSYRTVMTSGRSCNNCQRIGLWSSPNVKWDGLTIGSGLANNLRVIEETASHISSLITEGSQEERTCVL